MRLIRSLISLIFLGSLVYCGATVDLGERTFFGHVERIWSSDETQELVDGVKEKGGPVMDRVKRGVEKGIEAAAEDPDAGVGNP